MGAPSGLRGVELCPGFCARTVSVINNTEHYSDCDACSWGWRAMRHVICEECREFLPLYDWFFLAFCALIPLLLHSFFIYFYTTKSTLRFVELYQQACCLIECGLAAASALIFMPPRWSFRLYGCAGDAPNRIKDWYPAFYNPVVNFSRTLNCSHEVVFPLYSLPFIYFAFCLFFLVILRSLLYVTILRKEREHKQYYAALYCLPIVAGVHALFAGLLYHSFAYFTLLFAVGSSGVHLTREGKKSMRELLKRLRSSHRHHLLIAVNMILLAFAIVAIAVGR